MQFVITFFLLCYSAVSLSDVYRWTDKHGKTHYSDKRPKTAAENITIKVSKQNIDTSTQEHQKLEAMFRKENDADREFNQQRTQPSAAIVDACEKARERLSIIDGPVQFIDDKGKMVNVTEEERKKRVIELRKEIQARCKH